MSGALHLRHLCKRIQFGILQHIGPFNPVNGYMLFNGLKKTSIRTVL